jgi:hypothetical protein
MLVNASGAQKFDFEINFPEEFGGAEKNQKYIVIPEERVITSDSLEDLDDSTRIQLRTNFVIFIQIGNYASVSNSYFKWIDDYNKGVVPYIKDGRTMVPLRYLSEQLGAVVTYYEDTEKISVKTDATELILTVGEKEYTNDGLKQTMETSAEVINGRTFVPVRFVSEALSRTVTWVESDNVAIITPKDYPWSVDNEVEEKLYKDAMFLMSPMIRDLGHKMPK